VPPFATSPCTVLLQGNDEAFQFLEGVLDQVLSQFPCSYIHIGGDEVPKVRWEECPKCQARMDAEGLSTEAELQSWFVRRISNYLAVKGRKLIGERTGANSCCCWSWWDGGCDIWTGTV
jgi:hexosaminidase